MAKIPKSANSIPQNRKKTPSADVTSYMSYNPCWRFANFDINGKWGLSSLLGQFEFNYTDELSDHVLALGDDALINVMDRLNSRQYVNIDAFWSEFESCYQNKIPVSIIRLINSSLTRKVFFEKIFPKLQGFENNTWEEIRLYTHNKGKSNNHHVSIGCLIREAQDRLEELGFSDRSEIYSLRLEGKIRIYGFREKNYLDIIWVDLKHEIYPTR